MATEGHEPLADALEADADRLEQHGEELEGHIGETRQEWERKRADESVPGANPPDTAERDGTSDDDPPPDADLADRGS